MVLFVFLTCLYLLDVGKYPAVWHHATPFLQIKLLVILDSCSDNHSTKCGVNDVCVCVRVCMPFEINASLFVERHLSCHDHYLCSDLLGNTSRSV